jgi:hypothetical protein
MGCHDDTQFTKWRIGVAIWLLVGLDRIGINIAERDGIGQNLPKKCHMEDRKDRLEGH